MSACIDATVGSASTAGRATVIAEPAAGKTTTNAAFFTAVADAGFAYATCLAVAG